jgi:soluble lytic murein transglycosylase-like protein
MPTNNRKYSILKSIYGTTLSFSVFSAVILGMNSTANAGIFAEEENGKVIAAKGSVFNYEPPSENEEILSTNGQAANAAEPVNSKNIKSTKSAVVALKAEQTTATRSRKKGAANLPAPRKLSSLKAHQQKMFRLASDVGSRFAFRPEVRAANLSHSEFVAFFTTMIHRESNFKPNAVSPVGARGLGQLMPATAKELGVRNSFEPQQNLEGAATYLTSMLGEFGTIEKALAAYNAGPGAVKKYNGIPPYRETKQYVADILYNSRLKGSEYGRSYSTALGIGRKDSALAYGESWPTRKRRLPPEFQGEAP